MFKVEKVNTEDGRKSQGSLQRPGKFKVCGTKQGLLNRLSRIRKVFK